MADLEEDFGDDVEIDLPYVPMPPNETIPATVLFGDAWERMQWFLAEARWFAEDFAFFTRAPDFRFPWENEVTVNG